MIPRESKRLPFSLADGSDGDAAWKAYMDSCSDYLKRQLLIYQNWPQRRFTPVGYVEDKVFTDMNA